MCLIRYFDRNDNVLKIFPNPTSEILYVAVDDIDSQLYQYELLDLSGKRIVNGDMCRCNSDQISFPPGIVKGMYILKLSLTDSSVIIRKLIIEGR